jgi:signal transduction histidine kinase/CheY-like chemotaxis protein/HPt (histidine-containing phosphotransfer) domain-containing protein
VDIAHDIFVDSAERSKLMQTLQSSGSVENYQATLRKENGDKLIVKLNDKLIKSEDGTEYLEGSIQDITAQVLAEAQRKMAETELIEEKKKSDRLAEEAVRLSVTKSQFLANMSHEIRTPMNGILGYLSLIEKNPFRSHEELKDFIKGAKHSAESLLSIIDSILDISKIESGKMELDEISFSVKKIVEDSISITLSRATEKGLIIGYHIDDTVPVAVRGDPVKIRQVLVNLISNAIKFTEHGYVKVSISLEDQNEQDVYLLCSVTDTGIGIPSNKQEYLFEPFTQLDGSYTRKYGGTGLGLAITKNFIEIMGGNIHIESQVGKGSKFIFNLKLKKAVGFEEDFNTDKPDSQSASDVEALNVPSYNLKEKRKKYRILVAEDNNVNQKVVVKILNDFGYSCEAVENGEEAVNAVANNDFDAVLMDIQMPQMDGLNATKIIRGMDSSKKDIPIIAMTAHALIGDKEKCFEAGMNEYLSKPIFSEKLISILDSVLEIQLGENKVLVSENLVLDSVFNFNQLDKISLSDTTFQKELLSTYFDDVESRIQKLEILFTTKDLERIINEAHTIKGSSFSLGAIKLAEEALGIEISGKNNDLISVSDRLRNIKSALDETKEIVKHLM